MFTTASARIQPKTTLLITLSGRTPHTWRIPVSGSVLAALKLLIPRGQHGVHISRIGIDTLAEFAAQEVPVETFADEYRGTGRSRCWVRLRAGKDYTLVQGDAE